MAEVKNSFLKSKMNKDLDSRLVPNGEYRNALNVQVSKSETDDVGALENALGNVQVKDISDAAYKSRVLADEGIFESNSCLTQIPGEWKKLSSAGEVSCIGYYVDDSRSDIYMFLTSWTDDDAFGSNPVFSPPIVHYHGIVVYNTETKVLNTLVEGRFLNFSKNKPINGVNLLENILFWTDDRNQPRKINVKKPSAVTYYDREDKISVAKYYPYQAPFLIKDSNIGVEGSIECSMYDAATQYLPNNGGDNPYYDERFPGDPLYLEDKFIRFSYRFKFADGEYSLIAPFTQQCFIPKQDGYFIADDEKDTISSTNVSFMRNKVNKINLQIPLPCSANELRYNFDIDEIDVIYKESDGLSLKVVETIQIDQDFIDTFDDSEVCEYEYLSQKPYKTLPSNEVARVYDKVPVRALAQEVVANRVVYGNFQDKHTSVKFIDYQVAASEKYSTNPANVDFPSKSRVEYPNHTVKQNRNYQIGVVLSDRYGRQSSVILSSNKDPRFEGADDVAFGADTLYIPYSEEEANDFLGNSIKVLFNKKITSTKNFITGEPGLYDENNNPLGWYSYKIVVKQLEQDYYNVYTSGAIKGLPNASTEQLNSSFIVSTGDNINKIPRDLSEVGAQDKTFRSDTKLFGRVVNTQQEYSSIGNEQYNPGQRDFTVNTIEDLFDIFRVGDESQQNHPTTDPSNPYYTFLKGDSNPFICEFITSQTGAEQFGVTNNNTGPNNTFVKTENLTILETNPTVSNIDIYYETSTSGLISELNQAVDTDTTYAVGVSDWGYNHFESFYPNTQLTEWFTFVDFEGNTLNVINGSEQLTVKDGNDNLVTGKFKLKDRSEYGGDDNEYAIFTAPGAYFYYGPTASLRTFTFKLNCKTGELGQEENSENIIIKNNHLKNVPPSIDEDELRF